jgi:hypothetical protein
MWRASLLAQKRVSSAWVQARWDDAGSIVPGGDRTNGETEMEIVL